MKNLFSVLHKYTQYLETQRITTNQNHKSLLPINQKDLADFVHIYEPYTGMISAAVERKYADIIEELNKMEPWVLVYLGNFGQEHLR